MQGSRSTVVVPGTAQDALEQALSWLQQGEVVAFPTDTVYGLGAPLDRPAALEQLYRVKERPRRLGIPLLLAEAADLERVCSRVPGDAWRLAERFWPGGLTLVLPRSELVSPLVTGGRSTVAVRLPAHPVPRELARRLGVPLAASSANRSGGPAPISAAGVWEQLSGRIPLILDGGPCAAARPSTILDLTAEPPAVLRSGPVSPEDLAEVLGREVVGAGDRGVL